MTTIAALHVPNVGTIIGSDRQYTIGNLKRTGKPKWVLSNGWAVGFCGIFRTGVLLEAHFKEIADPNISAFEITNRIVGMMSEYKIDGIKEEGCATPGFDNSLILANPYEVFEVDGTFSPMPMAPNVVAAMGSGGKYAMGAGAALKNEEDPVRRVRRAIEVAIEHDPGSGGKVWTDMLTPTMTFPKRSKS